MDTKYWNIDRLGRLYKDWDPEVLKKLATKIDKSHWRPGYHITTQTGLLNDPNGFSYFNNQWHLFYQAFPYGAVHGLKSWQHMVSDDLVHWKFIDKPMVPDIYSDRNGCYSGSAINVDGKLFLMYTGNTFEGEEMARHPYQLGAWMDADNNISKLDHPLIESEPEGVTGHFRDPQVIKHGDYYYAFLGAQTVDNAGEILTYRTKGIENGWELYKKLDLGTENLGYMAECPNVGFVDGKVVVIFCPQGADKHEFHYDNVHPNAYIVADDLDFDEMKLINPSEMKQLDEGFDYYATQVLNAPDGRLLSVGWIGLPDTEYLSDQEGWEGELSMVRELHIENGNLTQRPVQEFKQLIEEDEASDTDLQKHIEAAPFDEHFNVNLESEDSYLRLSYDESDQEWTLKRKNVGEDVSIRTFKGEASSVDFYLDNTVFEIYILGGKITMTGQFFHDGNEVRVNSENMSVKQNKISNM
ncbi:sucrose-6-phosphate hydrolase [Apilactobacillus kunkeei]|uniref:Sucrose-6-phosphate hydrolase n=1 Tax=Apilactobacillus kunkeei TaxID=148814 RepID=A0A0M9DFE6_9LACO|nr:sucrose-6-phosphate hydrolase [Apilactobacillus kunkeei]KOY79753.1 Sucrose-6-p hydrolase [Apilactobacillus kunkeei]